jgi:hypothetical protein
MIDFRVPLSVVSYGFVVKPKSQPALSDYPLMSRVNSNAHGSLRSVLQ